MNAVLYEADITRDARPNFEIFTVRLFYF